MLEETHLELVVRGISIVAAFLVLTLRIDMMNEFININIPKFQTFIVVLIVVVVLWL